jgi:hypothetical protein
MPAGTRARKGRYTQVLGNTLNEHAGASKASGFKLESLGQLVQTKAVDSSRSLMHYLVLSAVP